MVIIIANRQTVLAAIEAVRKGTATAHQLHLVDNIISKGGELAYEAKKARDQAATGKFPKHWLSLG